MSILANLVVFGVCLAIMMLRRSKLAGAGAGITGAMTAADPSGLMDFSDALITVIAAGAEMFLH